MNHKFHWGKMLAAFRTLRQSLKICSFYMMKTQNWKLKYQFKNLLPQKQRPSKYKTVPFSIGLVTMKAKYHVHFLVFKFNLTVKRAEFLGRWEFLLVLRLSQKGEALSACVQRWRSSKLCLNFQTLMQIIFMTVLFSIICCTHCKN